MSPATMQAGLCATCGAGLTDVGPKGYRCRVGHWTPRAEGHIPAISAALPDGPRLIVTSMADVVSKPVDWLWERWLARGKFHVLGGHAGEGKGTLTAAIAAAFSTGGILPDGTPAPLARTLFLLAEDDLGDTLRPRLDLHGADVTNVRAIEAVREPDGADRLFNLERHLPLLEDAIRSGRIDLLVIDPISPFMPKSDRNSEGDVRDSLQPLGKLAERTGVAIIAVMHVGKPTGTARRPVQQLLGATAFGALARVVWMVAEIPEGDGRRMLGVVKSNIAMKPPSLEWSRDEDAPVVWHGFSPHDLAEVLGGSAQAKPRDDAEGFLSEELKGGSVEVVPLFARAKAAGVSERTLRRAAESLRVESFKLPGVAHGPWLWRLPVPKVSNPEDDGHLYPDATQFKMANPVDTQVAILATLNGATDAADHDPGENAHRFGKMSSDIEGGHLDHGDGRDGQNLQGCQGGHLDIYRVGHLDDGEHGEGWP